MERKVVAITGAASGIGAETAKLFRAQGDRVIGFDRVEPAFDIDGFHRVDLTDPSSIAESVAALAEDIDVLCNIAGVPPTADKSMVLKVNFFGLRHFVEQMAPRLRHGASVVSIASLAGAGWRSNIDLVRSGLKTPLAEADAWIADHARDGAPSYFLSKELLIAWTAANWDCWRDRGVRINAVSPGPVETPILGDFVQTLGKRVEDDLKINRAATVTEVVPVIAFLCTPEARWINGADISTDGGAGANALREMYGLSLA